MRGRCDIYSRKYFVLWTPHKPLLLQSTEKKRGACRWHHDPVYSSLHRPTWYAHPYTCFYSRCLQAHIAKIVVDKRMWCFILPLISAICLMGGFNRKLQVEFQSHAVWLIYIDVYIVHHINKWISTTLIVWRTLQKFLDRKVSITSHRQLSSHSSQIPVGLDMSGVFTMTYITISSHRN